VKTFDRLLLNHLPILFMLESFWVTKPRRFNSGSTLFECGQHPLSSFNPGCRAQRSVKCSGALHHDQVVLTVDPGELFSDEGKAEYEEWKKTNG
jgi:hypothetical protein